MTTWLQTLAAPLASTLKHPWVESIVRLSAVEDTLQALHPVLSLTQVRARVVRIVDETPTTKTFVLQANALWQGFSAGQFVRVGLEINGRRVERVYSLSSRPGARKLAITVKRQTGGLVSQHLHTHTQVGDVLSLSQAEGDFVLPTYLTNDWPEKILLLSAGSGITPVMAMLRDLQARNYLGDVAFFHVCRNAQELTFAKTLQRMEADMPNLSLIKHFTQDSGHLTADILRFEVPDLAQRSTWLCGPQGMMQTVHTLWSDWKIAAPLHTERFTAPALFPAAAPGAPVAVSMANSGTSFMTEGNAPLLVQAENAGFFPKHGCRIGICRSCQCTKKSGTVENLQTGELSSAPNEPIRLCISVARSDLALDL
jgi:ferredoxin-NADP reductase